MQAFWVVWMSFGSGTSSLLLAALSRERWTPHKPPPSEGPVFNAVLLTSLQPTSHSRQLLHSLQVSQIQQRVPCGSRCAHPQEPWLIAPVQRGPESRVGGVCIPNFIFISLAFMSSVAFWRSMGVTQCMCFCTSPVLGSS